MVSESSDNVDDTETGSEISDHESENPDLDPEGNSDVPYSEESSEILLLKVNGPCYYCNVVNVYERAVVKCPRYFWQDGYRICPICSHEIPVDRKHLTGGALTQYPPSEDEDD